MKTIEKIVVFLCAYLFCGWGTLFVQNANADNNQLRVFAYDLRYDSTPEEGSELVTYTFYFKSNVLPTEGWLIFYNDLDGDDNRNENGTEVGRYKIPDYVLTSRNEETGEHLPFSLSQADIPEYLTDHKAYKNMTWAIELKGDKITGKYPEATAWLNIYEPKDSKLENAWAGYNYRSYINEGGNTTGGSLYKQVREPRRIMEDAKFQRPQGIAIDNNPQSPFFGRVYIANTPVENPAAGSYKAGIVVFEPDPKTGKYKKIADGIIPKDANIWSTVDENSRWWMHRIAVNPVNGHVYYCQSTSSYPSAIYRLVPDEETVLDWENAVNVTKYLIAEDATREELALHPLNAINSLAFGPGGELYVSCKAGFVDANDLKSCGTGKIYKLLDEDVNGFYHKYEPYYEPRDTPQDVYNTDGVKVRNAVGEKYMIDPWVDADNSMVVNARGGFWVSQRRGNGIDQYAFLAHIHPSGYLQQSKYGRELSKHFQFALSTVDEETFSASVVTPEPTMRQLLDPHRPSIDLVETYPSGAIALYEKGGLNSTEALLAVGFNKTNDREDNKTKGRVCVFKQFYRDNEGSWFGFNQDWMFEIQIGQDENGVATIIEGLAFDYAGNLFVVTSGSRKKLYVYSLPNYNAMKTTPAVQPLVFSSTGARLEEFTNAGSSTNASNNLNRGSLMDDNYVAVPAKFDETVDAAIVYNDATKDKQWNTANNWNIKRIPGKTDIPVVVRANANITGEHAASGVVLERNSHITITQHGGLTVGEGGIKGAATDGSSIKIHNYSGWDQNSADRGAGYLRINPAINSKDHPERIPNVTVNYITKSTPSKHEELKDDHEHRLWQYFGAPGDNTTISISNYTWIYQWIASDDGVKPGYWKEYLGTSPLTNFMGYAITQADIPSYEWTTTPINQNHEVSWLGGDYIFANSYLAPINVAAFTAEDFTGNVDKTFYIFNTGSWSTWNEKAHDKENGGAVATEAEGVQSEGQYTAIPVLNAANLNQNTDPTTIAPMQGVYVRSKGEGTIKLDYEKHVWDTDKPGTKAMRAPEKTTSPDLLRRIRIQAYGENSGSDRLYILQDMRCTPDYDNGYDGKNMNAAGQVNIYTNEPCGKMEISSTNQIDGMYIGFRAGPDTTYTLRFTSLIGDSLCIKDLANDSIIALYEDSTYTFYAAAKSVKHMRFQVLLHPNPADDYSDTDDNSGTTTDLDNVSTSQMWITDQHLCISNQKANSTAKIYSVSGQLLISEKFNYQIDIPVYNLTTGVYILEVNNERYKFVRQN